MLYDVWNIMWDKDVCDSIVEWHVCAMIGYKQRKCVMRAAVYDGGVVMPVYLIARRVVANNITQSIHITIQLNKKVDIDFIRDYYSSVGIIAPYTNTAELQYIKEIATYEKYDESDNLFIYKY